MTAREGSPVSDGEWTIGSVLATRAERIQKQELRAEAVTEDTWDREQHGYVVTR